MLASDVASFTRVSVLTKTVVSTAWFSFCSTDGARAEADSSGLLFLTQQGGSFSSSQPAVHAMTAVLAARTTHPLLTGDVEAAAVSVFVLDAAASVEFFLDDGAAAVAFVLDAASFRIRNLTTDFLSLP